MNLDSLDQDIPKYWILLLHYWLPFFKTPSNFYFKCRNFIDDLKRSGNYFPWDKFPDLLFIFEEYAYEASEINISKKIIKTIFTKKIHLITNERLAQFFERLNPDNTRTPLLNDILEQLPAKLYGEYFSKLNAANCSLRNLKWCARLKDKFLLDDKLKFILSMPDDKRIDYHSTLSILAKECEEKLIKDKNKFNLTILNAYLVEHLLKFIFSGTPTLIFSANFIRCLINQLLETQNPILTSYLLGLDSNARFNFFENILVSNQNFQENILYFLDLCLSEQRSDLIDQLIQFSYKNIESEMTNNDLTKQKSTANKLDLLFQTLLQESTDTYPLTLFQLLAIQTLTKKPFDLETLKKVFEANHGLLEKNKSYSIEFLSVVAENSILAIKVFIKDHFMIHVVKENTRQDIHRSFYKFLNNEYIDKPLNVAKLILKKLPQHLQACCEADLNFLQQLLSQLYLIVDDPSIIKFKNERLMQLNKNQREEEEKFDARRELLQRIHEGKQSSVAYQRMEELFGTEASTMREKWKKNLGVHFFDANDKEERKLAFKEAAEIIKFNRECNTFCLSTSPSSTNYFTL
ncbi:hypothetical protein [Rickettsiella endosymbiont of Rhagonycha lignosa]|uniref:hypothetical protein n=1 Tax=Rickettsiella endosymbiont of Rhagonycha lignosa TaxID=3077937 RepID=UPI00313CCDC1